MSSSKKYCSKYLTTSRGTYTFHQEYLIKAEATKFCEEKGQILAPITSKEEFDKVHNYVNNCRNLGGPRTYHIGLYVLGNDMKFWSNHEKWDSAKHEQLFNFYYNKNHKHFQTYYIPSLDTMSIDTVRDCEGGDFKPICFKAAKDQNKKAEALVTSESSNSFTSPGFLIVVLVLVALVFSLAVTHFVSVRKMKKLKQKLPVSNN